MVKDLWQQYCQDKYKTDLLMCRDDDSFELYDKGIRKGFFGGNGIMSDGSQEYFIRKKRIAISEDTEDNDTYMYTRHKLVIFKVYNQGSVVENYDGTLSVSNGIKWLGLKATKPSEIVEAYDDLVARYLETIKSIFKSDIYVDKTKTKFYSPEQNIYMSIKQSFEDYKDKLDIRVTKPIKPKESSKNMRLCVGSKTEALFNWKSKAVTKGTVEDLVTQIKDFSSNAYIKHFLFKEKDE